MAKLAAGVVAEEGKKDAAAGAVGSRRNFIAAAAECNGTAQLYEIK
jgi:hypothetical protein